MCSREGDVQERKKGTSRKNSISQGGQLEKDMVDNDLWDLPHKIVTGKLNRKRTIHGIDLPGRLESIVNALFPSAPASPIVKTATQEEFELFEVSANEVPSAAGCLPKGKASGSDRILNEVLKLAVQAHPSRFSAMHNECLINTTLQSGRQATWCYCTSL